MPLGLFYVSTAQRRTAEAAPSPSETLHFHPSRVPPTRSDCLRAASLSSGLGTGLSTWITEWWSGLDWRHLQADYLGKELITMALGCWSSAEWLAPPRGSLSETGQVSKPTCCLPFTGVLLCETVSLPFRWSTPCFYFTPEFNVEDSLVYTFGAWETRCFCSVHPRSPRSTPGQEEEMSLIGTLDYKGIYCEVQTFTREDLFVFIMYQHLNWKLVYFLQRFVISFISCDFKWSIIRLVRVTQQASLKSANLIRRSWIWTHTHSTLFPTQSK